MKIAAIFPVGTSEGGCPVAIKALLNTEASVEVYLIYGNPGAPGTTDPKDVADKIRADMSDPRVIWAGDFAVEPWDFAQTFIQVREFLNRIAPHRFDRIYVGITGGSNPIPVSLFHLAMTCLAGEIIPVYVQKGAGSEKHFVASEIRDRVAAEDALKTARSGQVRVAARLAEQLPTEGRWKFLRSSLNALAQWDDFDYAQAGPSLRHLALKGAEQAHSILLEPVIDTVRRLGEVATQMSDFAGKLRDVEHFDRTVGAVDWLPRVSRIGPLVVADALANAHRRIEEGRFTDAVLRSYRAAECATQMRLLTLGIHPSKPSACPAAFEKYFPGGVASQQGPLAFKAGLDLLDRVGESSFSPIAEFVRKIGFIRNSSYLEHGYVRVQADTAERCIGYSLSICRHLLGTEIDQIWPGVQMRF